MMEFKNQGQVPNLPLEITPLLIQLKYVHNKTTAVTYMVLHRSAMEWAAFKSFASKNASSIEVNCNICTPKTCADKTGLAAINDGFNCGKLLNDGCGGTLNCMDNCEVGEVCSNGAINSACDLGDISDCGGNNRVKGHCEIDNGCTLSLILLLLMLINMVVWAVFPAGLI